MLLIYADRPRPLEQPQRSELSSEAS
jgi:hypothetical protein